MDLKHADKHTGQVAYILQLMPEENFHPTKLDDALSKKIAPGGGWKPNTALTYVNSFKQFCEYMYQSDVFNKSKDKKTIGGYEEFVKQNM